MITFINPLFKNSPIYYWGLPLIALCLLILSFFYHLNHLNGAILLTGLKLMAMTSVIHFFDSIGFQGHHVEYIKTFKKT